MEDSVVQPPVLYSAITLGLAKSSSGTTAASSNIDLAHNKPQTLPTRRLSTSGPFKGNINLMNIESRETEKLRLRSQLQLLQHSNIQLSERLPRNLSSPTSILNSQVLQRERKIPTDPRQIENRKPQELIGHSGTLSSLQRAPDIEGRLEVNRVRAVARQNQSLGGFSGDRWSLLAAHRESIQMAKSSSIPQFTSIVELSLLSKIQSILEEAMYCFGKKYTPGLLNKNGWDCPQAAESAAPVFMPRNLLGTLTLPHSIMITANLRSSRLTEWPALFRQVKQLPAKALASSTTLEGIASMISRIKYIRHGAVHRRRPGLVNIKSSMPDVVLLAVFLKDEDRASQLRKIHLTLQDRDFKELRRILGLENMTTDDSDDNLDQFAEAPQRQSFSDAADCFSRDQNYILLKDRREGRGNTDIKRFQALEFHVESLPVASRQASSRLEDLGKGGSRCSIARFQSANKPDEILSHLEQSRIIIDLTEDLNDDL